MIDRILYFAITWDIRWLEAFIYRYRCPSPIIPNHSVRACIAGWHCGCKWAVAMSENKKYHVEKRDGWSYVIGNPMPYHSGPWRYEFEAQDYADELNAADTAEPRP